MFVLPMSTDRTDLPHLLRDTVAEAARSWRLPATVALGFALGLIERAHTRSRSGLVFGVVAGLYTLFLGPLPWRVLVPLEEDGQRWHKFVRWMLAGLISLLLFAALVMPYAYLADAIAGARSYLVSRPRELTVSTLLFLVGGWGLARDVQLEQRLDRSERRRGRLTAELEEAKLYALRADLDPHFLFNALNAIASQCTSDPAGAEANIVRLSSLLRAILDTRRQALHPLDEELSLAKDYLGLLKARYPELTYEVHEPSMQDAMRVKVPPLLLQPLLENAVRHGDHSAGPIELWLTVTEARLECIVRSRGVFRGERDGGMGLELVRRRVSMAYNEQATFTIQTDESSCTVARIVAPLDVHPESTK
jgi:LytS/YehU family sensor histidine kinase